MSISSDFLFNSRSTPLMYGTTQSINKQPRLRRRRQGNDEACDVTVTTNCAEQ